VIENTGKFRGWVFGTISATGYQRLPENRREFRPTRSHPRSGAYNANLDSINREVRSGLIMESTAAGDSTFAFARSPSRR
jgi:hypothetical protein